MLMTRPRRWLGTRRWRRLIVLMLKKIPNPDATAQATRAAQYSRRKAKTTVTAPIRINEPSAAGANRRRRRSLPAARPMTTTPRLPAENRKPTRASDAASRCLANRTSWVWGVTTTKLINAIMREMLRSTGCPRT